MFQGSTVNMNVMPSLCVHMERYSTGYKCLGLTLFVGRSSSVTDRHGVKYIGLIEIQILLGDSNTNTSNANVFKYKYIGKYFK